MIGAINRQAGQQHHWDRVLAHAFANAFRGFNTVYLSHRETEVPSHPTTVGDDKGLGSDSGRSDTAAHSDPSASLADEDWINRVSGATLTLLCEGTVGA